MHLLRLLLGIIAFVTTTSSVQVAVGLSSSRRAVVSGILSFANAFNPTKALSINAMAASSKNLRIAFNGGDNMLGRAVQLSFPSQAPGEEYISDSCPAFHYLDMCLHPSGHPDGDPRLDEIRRLNREGRYLWKDYRQLVVDPPPDLRVLNFESHVTRSIHNEDLPSWKGIRYHAHADNLEAMLRPYAEADHGGNAASPVVVSLANNHAMDYGRTAFEAETLPALEELEGALPSVSAIGGGRNWIDASRPAAFGLREKDVRVFAVSSGCSGSLTSWWATKEKSGVVGLPALTSEGAVDRAVQIIKRAMDAHPPSNDGLTILSVHMGPNWALKGEDEGDIACRREFAHRVIDECGVDMVYGHSSHHVRGMEVYAGKLILYGTGDIVNDYEGFENPGEEKYNRLGGVYVADVDADYGNFVQLRIVPMFMNRLRLERWEKTSKIWSPREKRLVVDENRGKEMAAFVNKLSSIDAGSKKAALVVEYVEEGDSSIRGPVLVSKVYAPS
ncbi:hypothetical protein ACHAWF_015035 [Thalassiosira exigua]